MSKQREALSTALAALIKTNAAWKSLSDSGDAGFWEAEEQDYYTHGEAAISLINEALAEPEQEPFAWCVDSTSSADWAFSSTKEGVLINAELLDKDYEKTDPFPLYTSPQPREWQELSDEDRQKALESMPDMLDGFLKKWGWLHFSKAIEATCRDKNEVKA